MIRVLVTGGAGFIGSNFVRWAHNAHPDWHITTLDKLTYAGRLENLADVIDSPRHQFVHGDIADAAVAAPLVRESELVVHFAAETHVDRSIQSAADFITTDVIGTFVLLEAARQASGLRRFIQISTDEVYGSVPEGASTETDELRPRNPYSASKAGADRLAYSYWATYDVPVIVTRASNNYGPNQFPEKVIPLFVTNAIDNIALPLYGDGLNVRDWLHVDDHCRAIDLVMAQGTNGEVYNIGGGNEVRNVDLTKRILDLTGRPGSLIRPVADRPGHDRRYALDTTKLRRLGWAPAVEFEEGLAATVDWYRRNESWWRPIKEKDQAFRDYYKTQYGNRAGA
ncbi:MAG TPA: dTDP-glucose 4,6-dehydratase [Vicinamibacterales bacterium]|jgi:dTDP-glucose 4,6-dehydratase|nr:dTDP-glucose 4,6-dehydratase [Vicinamibacterales bacterium]